MAEGFKKTLYTCFKNIMLQGRKEKSKIDSLMDKKQKILKKKKLKDVDKIKLEDLDMKIDAEYKEKNGLKIL